MGESIFYIVIFWCYCPMDYFYIYFLGFFPGWIYGCRGDELRGMGRNGGQQIKQYQQSGQFKSKRQIQMQKYQEKPIALVLRDENGKYQVNQQALDLFCSIEGKLAIISVAGIYRTGKSFLLNTMLLNIKNGFAVGPTVNPKTKGIWVWGKPLIFKNDHDEIINVLVLDSEGLGSTEEDVNHDLRLFSITLLLSSAFMYNTVGAIDQNAIDRLGLVLRLCQHLKNDSYNDFPDFYWILRDFSLALVDKNNAPLTTKAYLQHCLSNQPNDSEYRNKIRSSIKQAFQNRHCYTFVRPLMNQESLQNLDKMQLEQLRPQFVEQVINFRKSIFGNLRVKSIKGREIKGSMLCELINIYVECINGDKLPVIESGWEQLCLKELHEVLFSIEEAVAKRVRDIKQRLPRTKKQLIKEQQALMDEFQEIFEKRLKNNDRAKQYFKSVEQIITKELKGIEENMKIKNSSETQAFVRKQFESIQKRLKQSEFKNMGQLVKQFEIFYEYYRKKCPYKDEIQTGLQLLMKKFSDSSLILFKSTHAKKDQEIDQLRQQIEKARAEYSSKQQKLKQEKNVFQDKTVKLEANIQQIRKQNDQLSQLVAELQGKLEIAENMNNNSMEEELTHENIVLKKKIMDLEDKMRELDCTHSQQINALKQQVLLRTNSAEHLQRQKLQLNSRLDQLELIYKNSKELNEQKIQDLMIQIEDMSGKCSLLQKNMKLQLLQRQQTIDDLERTIQLKNEEITEILQKNSQENSMLSEMILQEEKRCLQEKEKQVSQLRQELTKTKESLKKRIAELQSQIITKETEFKIGKLSVEQEKALLSQKIEFIKKESEEKIQKNINLQEELSHYVQMIEQKDECIQELTNEIQDLRNSEQMEGEQIQKKISEMGEQLQIKNAQIKALEAEIEKTTITLNKKVEQKKFKLEEMQILLQKHEEQAKKYEREITELKKSKEENNITMEEQIENMKLQNQRYLQDQKRNAELSLVQLKNFYEMEKERLEKRLLEERKKYQYNQANTVSELRSKFTKQIRTLNEENNQLNAKLEDLDEEITKLQNEYEIRIMGLEEDRESQRKSNQNRYELMKKKYEEVVEELGKNEKQHEEDRISFLKKIQGLNFEISKKQKQILQINVKKESLETTIIKKQSQLENIKKTMHQQIESSLKKVSETQSKYQKVNEQYSRYKIEAEKQNALLNQRNQFLNARILELTKDKDSGSLKNLQKIQRNKIAELKEQLDRQKSENMSLEAKMQTLRKNQKESSNQYKKEINELEKESMFSKQKIQISESKINELQIKLAQKTELFKKEVDEMRLKYSNERLKLQSDLDNQREKFNQIEDESKQKIFKLQMQLALVTDRITNVELQRDQTRKQLQETEKRLQNAFNQIKKQNEKGLDTSQMKRNSVDKRYSNQLELMKMSTKARQEQLEQTNKKLKQEMKQTKQKNFELQQRLNRAEKLISQDKNLSEEIEKLKREKQQLILVHRNQIQKEIDDWKRKYSELEKKNREIEKQNNAFVFILQKEKAKHNAEIDQIMQKCKEKEDLANWEKIRPVEPRTRTQASRSKKFSMTASDVLGNLGNWQ